MKNTEVNRAKGRKADAFTLIEIMVVLTILAALMGMGFVGYRKIRENADVRATKVLVEAVANGISAKGTTAGVRNGYNNDGRPTGTEIREIALWDCNMDGFVDGRLTVRATSGASDDHLDPASIGFPGDDTSAVGALSAAKYDGFAGSGIEVAPERINEIGQPMDAWQKPLRYAYLPLRNGASGSKSAYVNLMNSSYRTGTNLEWIQERVGAKRFVVWSDGPDGVAFTADDIASSP